MLYYRQKIILALLEEFEGSLGRSEFQKYLFLLSENQGIEKKFHFVPYKFGCYSFQSYKDIQYLVDAKYIQDENGWEIKDKNANYKSLLTAHDKRLLTELKKNYGSYKGDDLIRKVYLDYPYYTLHSEIVERILSKQERNNANNIINLTLSKEESHKLFTVGYEGISVEEYINKLIKNNIKVLCDVRKNPLSRKYGFSKSILSDLIGKFGIKYIHISELGIESDNRKNLKTVKDYIDLFDEYEKTVLVNQKMRINYLYDIFKKEKRIALTCFEEKPEFCHRTRIARYLKNLPDWEYELEEL